MFNQHRGIVPEFLRAMPPLRTLWVLGCSALALAGCGGGSGDTTPPPTPLAAPSNFAATTLGTFWWNVTPGATRYELYVDPDGAGPLPEAKADDFNQATGTGFGYAQAGSLGVQGYLTSAVTASSLTTSLNSTYRLRACDASGCGAFTESKAYDIVNGISYEFASGRVPMVSSMPIRLSKDGLTLAMTARSADTTSAVYVFTRTSGSQPWQQNAVLRNGKSYFGQQIAMSTDGTTLAVSALEPAGSDPAVLKGVIYTYQRGSYAWEQQAYLDMPGAPSGCPQPCSAAGPNHVALSADGNLLAASLNFSTRAGVGSVSLGAVATYVRSGATWAPKALLETGGKLVDLMALSGDGKTLAVNQGAFYRDTASYLTTTPFALIFTQQGDATWSQQARIPAGIVYFLDIAASDLSTMTLSDDGNTLAIIARNQTGHQTPELDIKATDLSCGPMVGNSYMAIYARNGVTWQRQAAISRRYSTPSWALASNGSGLFYGGALFTRSNGTWTCP